MPSAPPSVEKLPPVDIRARFESMLPGVERGEGGTSATLLGSAETGKSRLVAQLIQLAKERNWTILASTGNPRTHELPRGIVLEAMRPILPRVMGASTEEPPARSGEGPRLGLPLALAAFLPTTSPVDPRAGGVDEVAYSTPWELPSSVSPLEGDALLLRRLWDASRRAPVLLALDDAHWMDELSLGFVSSLCRAVATHRVLLLLSLDPEPAPQLARRFASVGAGGLSTVAWTIVPGPSHRPRPLPPPVPPPAETAEPSLLESLLGYGAVIGIEFDVPTLAHVTGHDRSTTAQGLEEAARRGWLWRSGEEMFHFAGERTWRWALGLAYTPLPERHAGVARSLETLHPQRDAIALFELAHHWQEAGEPAKALPYMVRSAEAAFGVGAFEAARDRLLLARGLLVSLPDPGRGPQEVRILVDLAEVLDAMGQGVQAGARLREALALAEGIHLPPRETVRIEVLLADLQRRWGHGSVALEILERARGRAAAAQDAPAEASVLSRVAMVERRQGRWSESRASLARALSLLGKEAGPVERALVHFAAADTFVWGGPDDTEAAREHIQEARSAYREIGQVSREVALLNLEGLHDSQLGDTAAALDHWNRAGELALRMGNLVDGANLLGNQAEVDADAGRARQAASALRTARELAEGLEEPRVNGQLLLAEATLAWRTGDLARANLLLDEGIQVLGSDASVDLRQQLEFLRARMLLSQGKHAEAREVLKGLDPLRYPHFLPPNQREEWERIQHGSP